MPNPFDQFMKALDDAAWDTLDCSVEDLPDYDFVEAFESDADPEEIIALLAHY